MQRVTKVACFWPTATAVARKTSETARSWPVRRVFCSWEQRYALRGKRNMGETTKQKAKIKGKKEDKWVKGIMRLKNTLSQF